MSKKTTISIGEASPTSGPTLPSLRQRLQRLNAGRATSARDVEAATERAKAAERTLLKARLDGMLVDEVPEAELEKTLTPLRVAWEANERRMRELSGTLALVDEEIAATEKAIASAEQDARRAAVAEADLVRDAVERELEDVLVNQVRPLIDRALGAAMAAYQARNDANLPLGATPNTRISRVVAGALGGLVEGIDRPSRTIGSRLATSPTPASWPI